MVTKKFRTLSAVLALTLGLSVMTGCGKKKDSVKVEDMVEKYSAFCELGEYKGLEYEKKEYTVTDSDVESRIKSFIAQHSTTDTVKEGKVADGDTVNIDFVGTVDGEEFQGGNTNGAGYDVTLGSGGMIPGFEEGIVGHSVGETFDINVTFPDDYQDPEKLQEGQPLLNGKAAVFKITINSKKITTSPEYNDAFIASNTDYNTVDDYEAYVRGELEKSYADNSKNANRNAIMNIVEKNVTVKEYPKQELEELVDNAVESVREAAASYNMDLSSYVTSVYGMSSEEEFRDYVADLAEKFMKEKIIICAIAKAESITVSDDEKQAEKENMMKELQIEDEDELKEHYTNEDILYYALSEKVYDFLLENNTGVEKTDTDTATKTDAEESDTDAATKTDAGASDTDASATDAE